MKLATILRIRKILKVLRDNYQAVVLNHTTSKFEARLYDKPVRKVVLRVVKWPPFRHCTIERLRFKVFTRVHFDYDGSVHHRENFFADVGYTMLALSKAGEDRIQRPLRAWISS